MPSIVAIETSTELASVALLHRDRLLVRESAGTKNHSQSVLPMLQEVLAQASVALTQCDAIAFGCGPGSFTGVRTACGLAQGLAFGLELPVLPIVTLAAMAEACRQSAGAKDVLCVLDARMGEVYWAQYRYDGDWSAVSGPRLSAPQEVAADGSCVACGNGLLAYPAWFSAHVGAARPECMPHAAQIAQLALVGLARGQAVAARAAQPLYLRNKVALTTQERAARAGT